MEERKINGAFVEMDAPFMAVSGTADYFKKAMPELPPIEGQDYVLRCVSVEGHGDLKVASFVLVPR